MAEDFGDDELAALTGTYLESLRVTAAATADALTAGDLAALATIAHRVRGAAGMFGFPDLTATAGFLEDAIREEQDRDLVHELARDLVQSILGVLRYADRSPDT